MRPLAHLLLVLLAPPLCAQSSESYLETKRRVTEVRVDAALRTWLRQTGAPGAAIAVVQGSELLTLQAHGASEIRSQEDFDPTRTIVWGGELVRMLTAAAVLQLHERGAVDLAVDVNEYLSDIEVGPALEPPVTLYDLLTESAGIDGVLTATRAREPSAILPLHEYLARRLPPRVRPARQLMVSSPEAFALAGSVVEAVSGQDFDDYLREHLTGPAGMRDTTVYPGPEHEARRATGHRYDATGLDAESPTPTTADYPLAAPGASLWTTAGDMAAWMQLLLAGGRTDGQRLLEPESVERLLTSQFRSHPNLDGRSLGMVARAIRAAPTVMLQTVSNGFSTAVLLVPAYDLGIFLTSNLQVAPAPLMREVVGLFIADQERAPIAAADSGPDNALSIDGWYRDAILSQSSPEKLLTLYRQQRVDIDADGRLVWQDHRYRPVGNRTFVEEEVGGARAVVLSPPGSLYLATDDVVLERLAWYEAWPVQALLWWIAASALLAVVWTPARIGPRRSGLEEVTGGEPSWPFALARLTALVYLLALLGLSYWLVRTISGGPATLVYGAPGYLRPLLALPRLGLVLSTPVVASVPVAWLRGYWGRSRWGRRKRWRLTLTALVLIAVLLLLRQWKLLGYQI